MVIIVDEKYDSQGRFGMDRDCLQKLLYVVKTIGVEKIRAIYGMCGEHFDQTKHRRLGLLILLKMLNHTVKIFKKCSETCFFGSRCLIKDYFLQINTTLLRVIPSSNLFQPYSCSLTGKDKRNVNVFIFWDFEQRIPNKYKIITNINGKKIEIHHLNTVTHTNCSFYVYRIISSSTGFECELDDRFKKSESDVYHVTWIRYCDDQNDHDKEMTIEFSPLYFQPFRYPSKKCFQPTLLIKAGVNVGFLPQDTEVKEFFVLDFFGYEWKIS